MRSRSAKWRLVAAIVFAPLFIGFSFFSAYKSVMLLRHGVETAGTVTDIRTYSCGKHGSSTCRDATVSSPDGVFEVKVGKAQVGSKISFIYQDGDRSNAMAGGRSAAWNRLTASIFGTLFGGLMLGLRMLRLTTD